MTPPTSNVRGSRELNNLITYLQQNCQHFQSVTALAGESSHNVSYIIMPTTFGAMIKVEYSTTRRIANVLVTNPRLHVRNGQRKLLAQQMMSQNVRNVVGHWVVFQRSRRVAYKTCVKFPKELFSAELVGECILSCLSAFQNDLPKFERFLADDDLPSSELPTVFN